MDRKEMMFVLAIFCFKFHLTIIQTLSVVHIDCLRIQYSFNHLIINNWFLNLSKVFKVNKIKYKLTELILYNQSKYSNFIKFKYWLNAHSTNQLPNKITRFPNDSQKHGDRRFKYWWPKEDQNRMPSATESNLRQ